MERSYFMFELEKHKRKRFGDEWGYLNGERIGTWWGTGL